MRLLILALSTLLIAAKPEERRITIDVKDAELHNVLRLLADAGKVNLVVPDEVKGKVSVKLTNVPWTEALDVILRSKGLGREKVGNVLYVDTLERITERIEDRAAIDDSREASAELLTALIPLRYANATDMKPLVQSMLTPRGTVAVDIRTNVLIVTDVAHNVARVRKELGI